MNNLKKKNGHFWVWFLTIPLLAFSAYRNLDLIVSTTSQDAGAIVAGLGALFALDLGVILWLQAFNNARGNQRNISRVMVIVDLLGAVAGLLADTMLHSGGNVNIIHLVSQWAIPIVIGGNFAGGIMYHSSDPERELKDRERELDDLLHEKLADALRDNSGDIIAQALPQAIEHRQSQVVQGFLSSVTASQAKKLLAGKPKPEMVQLNSDGDESRPETNPKE